MHCTLWMLHYNRTMIAPRQRRRRVCGRRYIQHSQNMALRLRNLSNRPSMMSIYCRNYAKSCFSCRSEPDDLSRLQRTAPHLSAILARAASKKRRQVPETHAVAPLPNSVAAYPGATEYRPSSTISFLSRLSSFKLATYSNKPSAIDALACAKAGWVNDGKDRLVCGICRSSWVVVPRDGMTKEAGMKDVPL